jgi:hypothetical protein
MKFTFQFQLKFALMHICHGLDLLTVYDDVIKLG